MALISMEHVSKIYPNAKRPALRDIDLEISRGEFVFLVGASGSGKTSLLRLLLREEEATSGEIRVGGYDLRRLPNRQVPQYRRSIGMVFQDYKLLNNKTVWENVAFALEVIGTSRSTIKSLVPKVLKTVGLTGKENNYPRELSGGEQQRVTIARAYVNHPQLLLADEPTGNLDPTTSLGIMEVLDAISRTGTTIVMATHNEEIVNSMRKRVVELNKGSIVRDEKNGSYDSAMYFPDEQVAAMSHAAINSDAETESVTVSETSAVIEPAADLPKSRSGKHERDERATTMVNSVNEILQSEHSNEGIARLAQSVHAGKTGRYGEAFADVEQTLTWGGGLSLEELAEQEGIDTSKTREVSTTAKADASTEQDSGKVWGTVTLEDPRGEADSTGNASAGKTTPVEQTQAMAPVTKEAEPPTPPMPPSPPKGRHSRPRTPDEPNKDEE